MKIAPLILSLTGIEVYKKETLEGEPEEFVNLNEDTIKKTIEALHKKYGFVAINILLLSWMRHTFAPKEYLPHIKNFKHFMLWALALDKNLELIEKLPKTK